MHPTIEYLKFGLPAIVVLLLSSITYASTSFGIFDARTMAMGGTSVASATNDNAQLYNPALLAFNKDIEERTEDSRFWFPVLTTQLADSAISLEEIVNDDLFEAVSQSVNLFNSAPNSINAEGVVNATARVDTLLSDIGSENLFADSFIGITLSEPGKLQGAGFFLGTRLLASGIATVTETDLDILDAYQEGLTFVATDGIQGAEQPEIFNANGALINPNANFDSTVSAAGASIIEIGIAMSRQIQLFGQQLAAGLSVKVAEVDTFEDTERLANDRLDIDQNSEGSVDINLDFGLVKEFSDNWRLGLAVKDIIPRNYDTSLGTKIKLRPRPRLGAAYLRGQLQIAVDADVVKNEPLADGFASQEAAIGAEWAVAEPLKLRAGYRHDMQGSRDGIASVGIGTQWRRIAFDIAYAKGSTARAAAVQLGLVF